MNSKCTGLPGAHQPSAAQPYPACLWLSPACCRPTRPPQVCASIIVNVWLARGMLRLAWNAEWISTGKFFGDKGPQYDAEEVMQSCACMHAAAHLFLPRTSCCPTPHPACHAPLRLPASAIATVAAPAASCPAGHGNVPGVQFRGGHKQPSANAPAACCPCPIS